MPKPVAEGEEDLGEDQPKILNIDITPETIIILEGNEEYIK